MHLVVKQTPSSYFPASSGVAFYITLSCKKFPIVRLPNPWLCLRASTEYDWCKPACTADTVMAHCTVSFLSLDDGDA